MVFHLGLPRSVIQYVQEIGRGGRDGSDCNCIAWVSGTDAARLKKHPGISERDRRDVSESWAFFSNITRCRHAFLDELMAASPKCGGEPCSSCDLCRGDVPDLSTRSRATKRSLNGSVRGGATKSCGPRGSANPCPQNQCGYALSAPRLGKYGCFRTCTKCKFSRDLSPKGFASIAGQQRRQAANLQPTRFFFAANAAAKQRRL